MSLKTVYTYSGNEHVAYKLLLTHSVKIFHIGLLNSIEFVKDGNKFNSDFLSAFLPYATCVEDGNKYKLVSPYE
jgi:hypothetical protein